MIGPEVPIIMHANNPFRLAGNLCGIEKFFELIIMDPDFSHRVMEVCLTLSIASNLMLADAGADILWIAQPTASANNISRSHYEVFAHPYNIRLFSALKQRKIRTIMHACGKWQDRFDLAVAEGPDMLHVDGIDMSDFRDTFGEQVSLFGQVPTQAMIDDAPEQILEKARSDMWYGGRGGGFILATSCSLSPMTKSENLHALIDAAKSHGTYTLTRIERG